METPFTQLVKIWVVFFLANSMIVFLINALFPQAIVLGTKDITPVRALFLSTALVALILVSLLPLCELVVQFVKVKVQTWHNVLISFAANTTVVWFLGRGADLLGLGLRSWLVAVTLGLMLAVVQNSAMKIIVPELE